jgi:hypothetical protein
MIERQLAELQKRVAKLETKVSRKQGGGWRETIGFAEHFDLFDEAMRLGADWRKRENKKR